VTVDKSSRQENDLVDASAASDPTKSIAVTKRPRIIAASLKFKRKRYPIKLSLAASAMLLLAFGTICSTRAQSGATDEGIDTVEVVKARATVE
jgi:hypothetical protein